jgi:DNA repair protein RadC
MSSPPTDALATLNEAQAASLQYVPRIPAMADLPRAFHPSNKLRTQGAGKLSLSELISLIFDGRHAGGRLREAERLSRRHGLQQLALLEFSGWRELGLGPVTAARFCAAFELGRRLARASGVDQRPRLSRPRQVHRQLRHLGQAKKEQLVGLYLDSQNAILHQETLSMGSLNTTRTHPREILYPALRYLALGFILAHNHPSGCLEPSTEDIEFTLAIRRAAELMGIELYDHLIISRHGYCSMRERGLL